MKRDLTEDQLRQEVTVALPLGVLLRINEEPTAAAIPARKPTVLIGAAYHGGTVKGITLNGDALATLVLLPGEFTGTHEEAKKWAAEQGGVLPSRHDGIVLFENKAEGEFKKDYYWLAEQRAGDEGVAWYQYFGDGNQYWNRVSTRSRARAVRRLAIQ